jgi:hypothetical protein
VGIAAAFILLLIVIVLLMPIRVVNWFNVVDPVSATVKVRNSLFAGSRVARTTLLSVPRQVDLDELLRGREPSDRHTT